MPLEQIAVKMSKRYSLLLLAVASLFAIAGASTTLKKVGRAREVRPLASAHGSESAPDIPSNDWKMPGPFGGTATALAVDPQNSKVVLAGAMDSLLFRSEDSGADWTLMNLPKRNLSEVTSILIDPGDSKHYLVGMVAGEGGGLFESRDRGSTWSTVKDLSNCGVRALAAAPSKPSRFVAGSLAGVMLSDDSGKTWKRISDPQNFEMQGISAVAIDTKDPSIIYAGTSHLPWKTMDGGKTWQSISTGMIDDSDVFSIYVDPAEPANVLASACSGIYFSSDRGDLWHKLLGIPNTSRRTHVVREDPWNPSTIYAGTTTGLFKSLDHGKTWKTLTNVPVNALAFDPTRPGTMYLAFEYEGLGKSDNAGEQINLINNGFVDRVISSISVSDHKLFAIETQEGETSGLFVSANQGESWVQLRNVRGLGGVHLKSVTGMSTDEKILLAASPHQMYKSVDGGVIWKAIPIRLIESPPVETARTKPKQAPRRKSARTAKPRVLTRDISPSEISGLYSIKSGTKEYLFAATDLGLLRSSDAGERWTLADIVGSIAVSALYSAPNSNGYLIGLTSAGLYLSKDFGDHWTELRFPLAPSDINGIAIPPDPGWPLLVATRTGLYSSADGGTKWYSNLGGIPASTVSTVIYNGAERTAYAVEYGQLYQTKDGGDSWAPVPSALPSLWIRRLWTPRDGSDRIYGITSNLGILFRE